MKEPFWENWWMGIMFEFMVYLSFTVHSICNTTGGLI